MVSEKNDKGKTIVYSDGCTKEKNHLPSSFLIQKNMENNNNTIINNINIIININNNGADR